MYTPYVTDAHVGFLALQSKHTLFSDLACNFLKVVATSAFGNTCCKLLAVDAAAVIFLRKFSTLLALKMKQCFLDFC